MCVTSIRLTFAHYDDFMEDPIAHRKRLIQEIGFQVQAPQSPESMQGLTVMVEVLTLTNILRNWQPTLGLWLPPVAAIYF